jgi:hypothetical protein
LSVFGWVDSYRRFRLYFNDIQTLAAELYEDGASTNGGTLTLYGKASGTVDTVISAAPTKLNYINNAANLMVGWNTDQGVKFAANGSGLFSGDLQVGSSNVTSVSLRITRNNATIPADANYFVASANTPNHSWIEGGYFTGELAGVITAPNSGYPYFENWAGQGSATSKSFGFVNKTSGTFISTDFLYTLSLLRTGQVRFNQYGSGTFTGTVAYNLAVDSSGNVIETAGGVVDGSGTANRLAKWSDSNTLTNANVTDDGSTVRINTLPLLSDSRLAVGTAGGDQTYASIFIGGAITSGTNQYALLCDPQLAGTGDNYALFANARIKANTAVTNAFGVYIPSAEKLSGATIANNYALYIANQTSGSSTNYSIYSSGGLNYFGGIVGIGATPVSGISLYIKGNGVDSPLLKMQGLANTTAMLGDTTTGTTDVGNLWLYNEGTLRIRLDSDTAGTSYINAGNFVVGSSSGSGYKVEFFGGHEDILRIHNTTTTGDSLIAFTNADGTLGRIQAVDGGGFVVDTPGIDRTNFLIGLNSTTIPNNAAGRGNLVVNGSSSSIMQMTVDGIEKGYVYHNGVNMELWNTADGDIAVGANNTQIAAFKAATSGQRNFVVGGSTALSAASNRGNITINGASNSILAFGVNNVLKGYLYNNGTSFYMNMGAGDMIFEGDTATPLTLNQNGFVGVRTTPLYQFSVNGSTGGIDFETNNNSTSATSILYTVRETGVSRTITTGGYTYGSSNPLTMVLTQNSNTPIGMYYSADNAEGAGLKGYKSRGTVAAPVSVNSGDTIFSMEGWAFHGAGPNQAKFGAGIRFVKDDTFGTANTFAPQRTEFYNAVNTTTVQTNVVIFPNGNTSIGSTSYFSTYKLYVGGMIASSTGFLLDSGQYTGVAGVPYAGMFMTESASSDGFGALLLAARTDAARPIIFGTYNGSAMGERARITATGTLLVNATNADIGGSVTGIALSSGNKVLVSDNTTGIGSFLFYGDRRGTGNTGAIYMLARGGFYKASIGVLGVDSTTDDGGITFNTISGNSTATERMRVTPSGVGINTGYAPDNPLEVFGADSGIKISSAVANRPQLRFECGTTENMVLSANSSYGAIGDSSSADRYMIFRSGNVGIGASASNPAVKLDIVDSTSAVRARVKNIDGAGSAGLILNPEGGGAGSTGDATVFFDMNNTAWVAGVDKTDSSKFKIANDVYGDFRDFNYLTIQTNGLIGISTTAPGEYLTIGRNDASDGNAYSLAILRSGTSAAPGTWKSTPAIRIEDISGDGPSSFSTTSGLLQINTGRIADADTYANNALMINCVNDNGPAFVVTAKRRVGVVQNQPSYALDVTGEIRATGDIIAYSDMRMKKDVQTLESALDKVSKLRGVSYRMKNSDKDDLKIGVIAQEVQQVIPEVVSEDDNGNLSVAYGNMVGLLIEAVKELSTQNKEQQGEIDSLKRQLASVLQRTIDGRI